MRRAAHCRTMVRLPPRPPSAQDQARSRRRKETAPVSPALPAQAAAQFISLFVFAFAARWYVAPWLQAQSRAGALTALLWVHVFRYVALQVFAAQREG